MVQTSSSTPPQLTGWRKYAAKFKKKPGSHFYVSIIDFSQSNAEIRRVIKYYGWNIEPDSQAMVNMVAAYAIVKALMPLRLAANVAMTPGLARIMDRMLHRVRQFRRAPPSGSSP
ncbi:hypothetical protein AMAG_15606 [Allomyces macrogynus ATCC 38327]|uniref:DUF1279 domain-containing protein n=1 Tax=Allomyces macrogynus (strain ATCC 38327) TaxID=578462 RepID=A0A0L0T9E7_ALLM3|nr:hypothetical protein AMAG_15606 [Allomyces macrogynus ATCC 38327]|eukprot:KNE71372.1 hypothetical protein AMAG_15606 [Allomyces macrogynus ATCC 38327]